MAKMIRIDAQSSSVLEELAEQTGKSQQALMRQAVRGLMRDYLFHKADAAYAQLQGDKSAWQQELAERAEWDVTLLDGLGNDDE